jgi:hypothetical protein
MMSHTLFASPIGKKDHFDWSANPRNAHSKPSSSAESPATKLPKWKPRSQVKPGTVIVICDGQFKGKKAVVVEILNAGILGIAGPGLPYLEIDRDIIVPTNKNVTLPKPGRESASDRVDSAVKNSPEIRKYLNEPVTLSPRRGII